MDGVLWAARMSATKRHHSRHSPSSQSHLGAQISPFLLSFLCLAAWDFFIEDPQGGPDSTNSTRYISPLLPSLLIWPLCAAGLSNLLAGDCCLTCQPTMDVQWMQNFLCLPQCDAQPCGTSMPLKTNRSHMLDDLEGDDDIRPDYTCPFCYEDFDIASLCSHIDDEHCYESDSAACPVCAAKIVKDLVGHITLQHGHLFKMQRRRRYRKAGTSSSNTSLAFLSKELRESNLQALLGGASSSIAVTDPLFSTVVCAFPLSETDDVSKPSAASKEASEKSFASSMQQKSSMGTCEKSRQEPEEEALRAKFVQHLLLSMFFRDN